jgi:hypothetical protein
LRAFSAFSSAAASFLAKSEALFAAAAASFLS